MERSITFADLTSAREHRDPKFSRLVIDYLAQPDPPERAAAVKIPSEENPEAEWPDVAGGENSAAYDDDADDDDDFDDDDDEEDDASFDIDDETELDDETGHLPQDAWTVARLRAALASQASSGKTPEELRALRQEAWGALLAAPHPLPRLFLGELLIDVYEEGTDWARTSLVEIFREARLGWGSWKGLKHIYKMAEERHDAEMFGVLAWRLDAIHRTEYHASELSGATLSYMRHRAWRYLRQLGQAIPELYPQFAVQVLRHYPDSYRFAGSWVANQNLGAQGSNRRPRGRTERAASQARPPRLR